MLSPQIKKIFEGLDRYKENDIYNEERGPSIDVNRLTGKMGVLYEKLRYVVDYKEKHTIERSAIERILNRGLFVEGSKEMGAPLLQELVGGGYLPNKSIPEAVADDIQTIINKYVLLDGGKVTNPKLVSLIATEIEIFLHPQILNTLVSESLYETVSNRIEYSEQITKEELDTQTFIGCKRSLLGGDQDTLLYALVVRKIPELPILNDVEEIRSVADKLAKAITDSEKELKNPLGWKISSKLKNQSVFFSVIKEIIDKYGTVSESIFSDKEQLEEKVKEVLSKEYKKQEDLVRQSGTRAVIYLLLTKVILALILELPYEIFVLSHINYFALATNIFFHPLLLLLIVNTVKSPKSNNTNVIIAGIEDIVEGSETKPIYVKSTNADFYMNFSFAAFYTVLFFISFGIILGILTILQFNIVSILLFLFFLTLVSSFGFRIHAMSKKWQVYTGDERILTLIWNLFTMPIIRTGRWLSRRFSSINVLVFFMDFLLETPFKFILGTFDSFISFLKEKDEDTF